MAAWVLVTFWTLQTESLIMVNVVYWDWRFILSFLSTATFTFIITQQTDQ